MKVKNGKIIEATESELFGNYLKLGFDDIFDFHTYKRKCEASGVKIIEEGDNNVEGFPENLKRIREKKGLTQRKLSEISGIETSRICSYEKGHHQPTLIVLEWLCQSLKVSASELLGF